jgi:hypothetical protein
MKKDGKAPIKALEREVARLQREIDAAHKAVAKMENNALIGRKILEQNLPDYARLHFEGAKVAADKGDTRPAEWAMTHAKSGGQTVVEAPGRSAGDTGTKVFIGIKVGSMPLESLEAEIISSSEEPQTLLRDTNR